MVKEEKDQKNLQWHPTFYACIYKSDTAKVDEIKADDITLTFAVKHFPREMVKEIQRTRNLQVVKFDEGIYHISGDMFPIQIIHTAKLSKENNFWLRNLRNVESAGCAGRACGNRSETDESVIIFRKFIDSKIV